MGLFGKLIKTGFDVVTAPVEVVKDGLTLGGLVTNTDEPYSVMRIKKLASDVEEVREEADDL
jgi:hypothetical protein